jgi:hypothetical protein
MDILTQVLTGSLGGAALGLGGLFLGIAGGFAGPQILDLVVSFAQSGFDLATISDGLGALLP